jgi:hypothetical protein
MKAHPYYHQIRTSLAALVLGASVLFVYHLLNQTPNSTVIEVGKSRLASRNSRAKMPHASHQADASSQATAVAAVMVPQEAPPSQVIPCKFQEFNNWAVTYSKASPVEQSQMLARGEAMVKKRHEQMAVLIEQNPKQALAESDALSPLARDTLPESLKLQLEQPVNARGDLIVVAYLGENNAPYKRFTTLDNQEYTVYPAGKNESLMRESNRSLLGIKLVVNNVIETPEGKKYPRVDRVMALRKDRVRVLSKEEVVVARRSASTKATPICSESTKPITVNNAPAAIETGGNTKWMCKPDHITAWLKTPEGINASNNLKGMVAVGGPGEGAGEFIPLPEGWSTGNKSFLCVRFRCPNQPTTLYNNLDTDIPVMLKQFGQWSYGRINFTNYTLSSLLVLPHTFEEYKKGLFNAQNDAWDMAAKIYNLKNYSFKAVCVFDLWPFPGSAEVGGDHCQINDATISIIQHELGHCFGLPHANMWVATTMDPIGLGYHHEYWGSYDSMGYGNLLWSTYNTMNRFYIRWLTLAETHDLASRNSGIYTIYDPDVTSLTAGRKHTIRIPRSDGSFYFVEFRPRPTALTDNGPVNVTTQNGIRILRTNGAELIDVTPLSEIGLASAADAALLAGKEFYDAGEDIRIKAISKGGSSANQYFDVQVSFSKSSEIKSGHAYALRAQHSNLTVGVQFTSLSNGALLQQLTGANAINQKWMLVKVNSDNYKLVNTSSGKVLEVGGHSMAEGGVVQQWDWTGTASQQWKIVPVGSGYFKLVSALSGLALSIPNSSTQVGTELRQYTYYGMTSQNWAFDEMSPLDVGMRYAILSRNSGKAVDVDGFAATDGANIIQYDWFNTGKQCWLVNSLGGAEQTFSNVATGKIIEVGGYSNNDGGNINQWGWAGHNWQRWTVEAVDSDAGGFWYKIVNVGSGKVVDIAGMSNANMANIQQWTYWGGYNQQWRFVRVN